MEDYFKKPGISNSLLGNVQSIAEGRGKFKCSPETLDFGSQVHELLLEPDVYAERLYWPNYDANRYRVQNMATAAQQNPVLAMLLADPNVLLEKEYFFKIGDHDCKMKADIVSRFIVGDIKTTDATTRAEFEARALEYGYNRQGAFYLKGTGCTKFIIFAISKKFPHPTFTYVLNAGDPVLVAGEAEYMELLDMYDKLTIDELNYLYEK